MANMVQKKDLAFYTELKRIANDGLKSVCSRLLCVIHGAVADYQCVVTQCLQAAKINSDRGVEQYMGNGEISHQHQCAHVSLHEGARQAWGSHPYGAFIVPRQDHSDDRRGRALCEATALTSRSLTLLPRPR